MNMAHRLPAFNMRSREQWLPAANRFLPPAACVVLSLAIAYELAELTWRLVPGEAYGPAPEVAVAARAPDTAGVNPNLAALRGWHPFGVAAAEPVAAVLPPEALVDAPDTTLNLTLTATIVRSGEDLSEASIQSGNQPDKRYLLGAPIEGASGATLQRVYDDRVILNRSGQLETLRFPEEQTPRRASATARVAPPLPRAGAGQGSLRQVISANASRLTDIIRLAPQVEGGQVVGFRVNPGRDEDAFTALGLQAGDVVTDINGLALDDPSRGLQAFEALGESTMANVTVMRDGSPQVLVIDTSQLNSLSEDRQ
jgi:general secretion pathway protein C